MTDEDLANLKSLLTQMAVQNSEFQRVTIRSFNCSARELLVVVEEALLFRDIVKRTGMYQLGG